MRLQQIPVATQVAVFFALFGAGMWASKMAHPLYFEEAGQLGAFGAGYAVMAVVGGLSFAWGKVADTMGGLRAARLGLLLYAIGIAGRIFANFPAAVVSSAVAGAGASLVIVAVRPWVRSVASDDEIPRVVAARNAGNQSGVLIGSLGAGLLLALPVAYHDRLQLTLLVAPAIVLLGWVWLSVVARTNASTSPPRADASTDERTRAPRGLSVRLVVIGVVSGLYISMLTPYAPLILTDAGVPAWGAPLVVGASSFIQLGVSWALSRRPLQERSAYRSFVVAEIVAGAATLGIAASLGMPYWVIVFLYFMRAGLVSLAVIAEELIQYLIIPAASMGVVFGLSQTAFLSGDALGGLLGATLWQHGGAQALVLTAGVLTLVNAALVAGLLRAPLRQRKAAVVETST